MKKRKKGNVHIILAGLVYTLLLSCNSNEKRKSDFTVKQLEADSNVTPTAMENIYSPQKYIDSMNELKDFRNIPYFLSDSCIDGNAVYWKDLHHPTSIRKYVIEKTTNIDLLKYIIKNNLYTNKCNSHSPNTSIPYYNQSLNDMIKERLDSLLKLH